jgi:predicted transcriptional regulator
MLRILKNCGFDGSGICFESQSSMATACCCSVRTLRNLVNELEEEGFINVNRQLKNTNKITLTAKTLSYMENFDVIGRICRQKR